MKNRFYVASVWSFVAAVGLAVTPARAQTARDKASARALTYEGDELARKDDCQHAIEKYERAASLYPAASILTSLAECQIKLGKLVEGTETARQVLREELGTRPKQAFADAQRKARDLVTANEGKIGRLRLLVAPASGELRVRVDDEVVRVASLGVELRVDPGPHVIVAEAPGYLSAKREVTIEPGASQEVEIQLELDATPRARPIAASAAVAGEGGPRPRASYKLMPAYVSYGVGGVGLIVGTVFGLQALSTKSRLDDACNGGGQCPSSTRGDVDGLATKSLVSTIGFGVALAGAGVGTYFLLKPPFGGPRSGLSVRPWVGLGGGGVAGTF